MEKYNPKKIEKKWQDEWEKENIYKAEEKSKKPKKYILIEFPYPSGAGLHVGHCRPYCALDTLARKKKMEGNNVLFPIGWDAFGLPTENFAIKNKIHPQEATEKNIANFKKQIKSLGLSFDWSREINTTDPKYYKWTQWIFLKLFEKGLAYQAEMPINWCPSCKIGLANEEVVGGKCERCGTTTEKKIKKQWMLKITAYADKLIEGLEKVDYPERVKTQQINWIGKSTGAEIKFNIVVKSEGDTSTCRLQDKFKINNEDKKFRTIANNEGDIPECRLQDKTIKIFTTRPDTLFGCTYMVVCPEHKIISNLKSDIANLDEVEKYLKKVKKKSDLERTDLAKEKTGVELKGIKAINPVNNKEIPIFVADYVLPHYSTGAIMAVPAHDERDFEFAKKYGLPIKKVIEPPELQSIVRNAQDIAMGAQTNLKVETECYIEDGINVNSDFINGLETKKAKEKITKWLEKKGVGEKAVNYKLRDWIFSRQHYWGEPIPLVHCKKCGIVPIPEKDLPVKLPYVEKYQPTKTGESPLTNISKWVNVKCPKCGSAAKRETDTMPNWAGSSWYFLRYLDPKNNKTLADFEKIKYWMPVDFYNGGMEHTTLHLLYSRFWHKFLFDIGIVPQNEPYQKRTSHGMVLAEDGRKMSKSFGNVINPDDVVKKFGADSLRLYEMFMGPFEQTISWNEKGLVGMERFLQKVAKLFEKTMNNKQRTEKNTRCEILLHQTIKKVTEDIDNFKFNTAIAQLMILLNEMEKQKLLFPVHYSSFIKLLSPFAPHIAEEIYQKTRSKEQGIKFKSIFEEEWPKYDEKLIKEEKINLIIQINGKVRDQIEVDAEISEDKAREIALSRKKVVKWIKGKEIKKIIFVKGKLINIVV
jgi:leucyl-tRNA synthetase